MNSMNNEEMREKVRQKYAVAITRKSGCGCTTGCCGSTDSNPVTGGLYIKTEYADIPEEAFQASLGCGNPTALSDLHAGETVLDLGSGAGLDVLLSARRVGPYGKAFGLDMTDEMLAAANANKAKAGAKNVEFLKGHIEDIPLPEGEVDVVISNCVINLSTDKQKVFSEIHRVLKPGGRMAVSDIVLTKPLPEKLRQNVLAWAGCIAGSLEISEYKTKLAQAGFGDIEIQVTREYDLDDPFLRGMLSDFTQREINECNGAVVSAFIRAKKPAHLLVSEQEFTVTLAGQADFAQIHELLQQNGLPTAGVDPVTGKYYVAKSTELIGVVGTECYGASAMLRSLAVKPQCKKSGVAKALISKALDILKSDAITDVYVITNTAEKYLNRFGFVKVDRSEVPATVLNTSALGDACPASSTHMHLRISDD